MKQQAVEDKDVLLLRCKDMSSQASAKVFPAGPRVRLNLRKNASDEEAQAALR